MIRIHSTNMDGPNPIPHIRGDDPGRYLDHDDYGHYSPHPWG